MTLEFELKPSFGHQRFYPKNRAAQVLVELTGRKCLDLQDLERLHYAGFQVFYASRTQELNPIELIMNGRKEDL